MGRILGPLLDPLLHTIALAALLAYLSSLLPDGPMQPPTTADELARYTWPEGWTVEYGYEPWNGWPMPPIVDRRDKGPARTPPVRRHFWPRTAP